MEATMAKGGEARGPARALDFSLKKSNLHKMQTKPDKIAGVTRNAGRVEVLCRSGTWYVWCWWQMMATTTPASYKGSERHSRSLRCVKKKTVSKPAKLKIRANNRDEDDQDLVSKVVGFHGWGAGGCLYIFRSQNYISRKSKKTSTPSESTAKLVSAGPKIAPLQLHQAGNDNKRLQMRILLHGSMVLGYGK